MPDSLSRQQSEVAGSEVNCITRHCNRCGLRRAGELRCWSPLYLMYIRFVIHRKDEDSRRRQGLFQAMSRLEYEGVLLPYERASYDEIYSWFRKNLKKPRRFSRSSRPHAKKVAISWFKDTAKEHIAKMYAITQILEAHGVSIDVIRTERPGYIVYEDTYQVTAEPFSDTMT